MAFALPGTSSTVAPTNPRCHLDRKGEISNRPRTDFLQGKAKFFPRYEM